MLTSIESIDPAHGGDDVISGQWVTGLPTAVTFGDSNGAGTITLASGTWASLGYAVGDGIYIQGTGTNGNGATFTGNNFYTIAAISNGGATLTLQAGETLTASQTSTTVNLAPVTITSSSPLTGMLSAVPTAVAFGYSSSNVATITLASGGSWAALGYTVGQGVYIQGNGRQRKRYELQSDRGQRLLHDRRDQRRDADPESRH